MILKATINDAKQIVEQFASAVHNKDFELIDRLLADDGDYNNRQDGLPIPDDNTKKTFIKWFIEELSASTVDKVDFDTCNGCSLGNPVVLFNGGQFPASKPERGWGNNATIAMMLSISDGKINKIKFCNQMAVTKSKFWFQIIGYEIMQYETETGASFNEAYEVVLKRHNVWTEGMGENFREDDNSQLFKPMPVPKDGPMMRSSTKVNIRESPDWEAG